MTIKFTSGIQPAGYENNDEPTTNARYSNQFELQTVGGIFTEGQLSQKAQQLGMDYNTYMEWLKFAGNFGWMPEQLFQWLRQENLSPNRLVQIYQIAVDSQIPFNDYYYKYYKRGIVHPNGKKRQNRGNTSGFSEVTGNVQMASVQPQCNIYQNPSPNPDPEVSEIIQDIQPKKPKAPFYNKHTQQEIAEASKFNMSAQQYKVLKKEANQLNLDFGSYLQLRGKCQKLNISVQDYIKEFGHPNQSCPPVKKQMNIKQKQPKQMPIENTQPMNNIEFENGHQPQPDAPDAEAYTSEVISETNPGKTKDRQMFVEDKANYQKNTSIKRPAYGSSYVGEEPVQVGGVFGHAEAVSKKQPVFGNTVSGLKEKSTHKFGNTDGGQEIRYT